MKCSRIVLRITLCFFSLYSTNTACSASPKASRGIRRSGIDQEAYAKRRAQGSELRRTQTGFDASLESALSNPIKWAQNFLTVELVDWERSYTGQQISDFRQQVQNFLVSLQAAGENKIALIKAMNKIPATLAPGIQKALRKIIRTWKDATKQTLEQGNPLEFVATTANILGSFDDPFEFDGIYGEPSDATRQKVFDLIVSQEALAKNLPKEGLAAVAQLGLTKDQFIAQAIEADKDHGPTLKEVVTPELLALVESKLKALGAKQTDIDAIKQFVTKYGDQKIFYFMRNNPPDILKLEKALKDAAADKGKSFDLPVLGSKRILTGKDGAELKKNLADAVFTSEVIGKADPTFVDKNDENKVKPITVKIDNLKPNFLAGFFKNGDNKDLYAFTTPAGLAFFYWLYQALIFELISQDTLIDEINAVKESFAQTLGDPQKRAETFKQRLIAAGSKLLFTQEADQLTRDILNQGNLFLPVGKQNTKDGTNILLASDFWEPEFEIVPFNEYGKYKAGKLTAILATQKNTQQKFLLVSGHGHSEQAEDGRDQMKFAAKKLEQLMQERDEEIFLIIGVDANTKKKVDVEAFQKLLGELGLVSTHVGPTTIKRRMVTVQHGKSGLYAVDEEDYIIVKKDQLILNNVTVGFKPAAQIDLTLPLPNMDNQSDHYAVSALVQSKQAAKRPVISEIQSLKKESLMPARTFTEEELVAPEPEKTVATKALRRVGG